MYIHIKPESETPIYTQLIYQIKAGIIRKELVPGDPLPSVRNLAGDIGVNMHTVNKAYHHLAEEKIIRNHKKRFIVADDLPIKMKKGYLDHFKTKLTQLTIDIKIHQLSDEDVSEMVQEIKEQLEVGTEK